MPPKIPATAAAVVSTAIAAAFVSKASRACGGSPVEAIVSGLTMGLATGYWSVASTQLWQHGPASAAVAGAIYSALRKRYLIAGAAFGLAILIRPHLAVVAAVVGLGIAASTRSIQPALRIGVASGVGFAALLMFNWWVWGVFTISGGYGSGFSEQFLSGGLTWYAKNVLGAVLDPTNGIVFISPLIVVLAIGVRRGWKAADPATRYSALGGLVYLLIQLRANRFSGGEGHFGYRYPIEAMTAAAPLFFVTYRSWTSDRRFLRYALMLSIGLSVAIQMWGVLWWPR